MSQWASLTPKASTIGLAANTRVASRRLVRIHKMGVMPRYAIKASNWNSNRAAVYELPAIWIHCG